MAKPRLSDVETWETVVNKVIRDNKNTRRTGFRKWLLSKENIGGKFFDSFAHLKIFNIRNSLINQDRDHFVVVSGKEGQGKSTLAIQYAAYLDPKFNLNKICFTMKDYIKQLKNAKKGDVFILDEGNMFLFSRESYTENNRFMVKLFAIMRQKNLCTIICIPNFWTIDSYVRDHRVDTFLYIHHKGKYIGYVGRGIKVISRDGQRNKSIGGIKIPDGTFWMGYFNKGFPTLNDLNEDTYKEYKAQHFNDFLNELEKLVKIRDDESKYVTITKARKIIPLQRDDFVDLLKDSKLKGKQIYGKWFIERKSLKEMVENKQSGTNSTSNGITSLEKEKTGGGEGG